METGRDVTNSTWSLLPSNGTEEEGFGSNILNVVHVVAMVNLATSIAVSVGVIAYFLWKHKSVFKRPIGERLVFYLAVGDLCFSIAHCTDHAIVLYMNNEPPKTICSVLGFFMTSYFNSPSVIVIVTAVNAFSMVVLHRRLNLGKYDWKLLGGAFVVPQAVLFVFAWFGWLGSTGVWCGFNYSTPQGEFLGQFNAVLNIVVFIITLLCYLFILITIRSVAAKIHKGGDASGKAAESAAKYHKSARIMMIFVVSYALQYWAITIYYSWEFFGVPHISIVFLTVTFTNQGGLFNFFAYTYVRRKYSRTGNASTTEGMSTTMTTMNA